MKIPKLKKGLNLPVCCACVYVSVIMYHGCKDTAYLGHWLRLKDHCHSMTIKERLFFKVDDVEVYFPL